MSTKSKTVFVCTMCGHESPKWQGKCPGCDEWNTLEEEVRQGTKKSPPLISASKGAVAIDELDAGEEARFSSGIGELDRVLGGGAVKGSLVLFGGEPGIGKSTLLLQVCAAAPEIGKILYISGEESPRQIKLRAQRLDVQAPGLLVFPETDMDRILAVIEKEKPRLVIVDSVQTVYSGELTSVPGSVSQVRECTMKLMRLAKEEKTTVFIVGHVNKEGAIAGPKVLEHMVDAVLYFEGDRNVSHRILRAAKNRFGSTNEVGVFEMGDAGLAEVKNPSEMLLSGRPQGVSGTAVVSVMEGTRPLLAEVQALVTPTPFSTPRRTATGFDYNRMALLMAVLEKRMGLLFSSCDAYVNVIGGLRINETAADLGVVLALASSLKDKPLDFGVAAIGEVGLTGELRSVSRIESRIAEVKRLGLPACIIPAGNKKQADAVRGIDIILAENLKEVFKKIF